MTYQVGFKMQPENKERNKGIYESYKEGISQRKIAKKWGISPSRVGQIIQKFKFKEDLKEGK